MGRDVAGLRVGSKSNAINVKPNGTVHVSPKALPESVETKDSEPEGHAAKDERPEKVVKAETQKLSDEKSSSPVKPASGSAVNGTNNANSFEPMTPGVEGETSDLGPKCSPKSSDLLSPGTGKKSQLNSPFTSRQQQPHDKKYLDDDDNYSLASSTATSRTSKFRVTVPVGPSFVCGGRLERRKEVFLIECHRIYNFILSFILIYVFCPSCKKNSYFPFHSSCKFYSKLEEKHKALEQERLEYEARTRDEEQEAIKQLRKSMMYKANPIPGFYREGPPQKAELKKLPLTRPKSPNLTRRKSCGDAAKSSPAEKGLCGQATRHSVGVYKEGKGSPFTPKSKDRISARKSNGTSKLKDHPQQLKETVENPPVKELGSAEMAC